MSTQDPNQPVIAALRPHRWASPLGLLTVCLAAGLAAAAASLLGLGPFADPPSPRLADTHQPSGPIDAGVLFPSPSPQVVERTVDVYDPPVVIYLPPTGTSSAPAPAAHPSATATPPPAPPPTEPPEPGDGGGGDG